MRSPLLAFTLLLSASSALGADYISYHDDWKAPPPVATPSRAVYIVVVDWLDNEEFEMRVDKAILERFGLKAGDRVTAPHAFAIRGAQKEFEAEKLR